MGENLLFLILSKIKIIILLLNSSVLREAYNIYVTNFYPPFEEDVTTGNAFLKNNGDGSFSNIALDNDTRFDSIGWGAVFLDADNDTDMDLYVSSSIVANDPDGRLPSAFYEYIDEENYVFQIMQALP